MAGTLVIYPWWYVLHQPGFPWSLPGPELVEFLSLGLLCPLIAIVAIH